MFKEITSISKNYALVKIAGNINDDILNFNVIFEEPNKKILGEIVDIDPEIIKVRFLGEMIDNKFYSGVIRKPNLSANVRIITKEEFAMIVGDNEMGTMEIGISPLYDDCPVRININDLLVIYDDLTSELSWFKIKLSKKNKYQRKVGISHVKELSCRTGGCIWVSY